MPERSIEPKKYLIVIRLKIYDLDKIQKVVPQIQAAISSMTTEPIEIAFTSAAHDLFGFFVKSTSKANQFVDFIRAPTKARIYGNPPILDGGDSIFVIELGVNSSSDGFGRAHTWLQRH